MPEQAYLPKCEMLNDNFHYKHSSTSNNFFLNSSMNQFSSIIEVWTSFVSNDEEISTQTQALMINTCESSHYLGQL